MIPKSDKLVAEESTGGYNLEGPTAYMEPNIPIVHGSAKRKIKELYPYNDYVAVWVDPVDTAIVLSDKEQYKNEGVVVGVGPQVKNVTVGDMITFHDRAITTLTPSSGFYAKERILLINEHSCLLKIKIVDIEKVVE